MKLFAVAAVATLGVAVSGCATVVEGTTQSVSVSTTPVEGAQCTLSNSQGTWYAVSPGSVVVHKTKTDLDVVCQKAGYEPGHVVAISHFGGATAGNLLLGVGGAVVGGAVDAASGANFSYDNPIVVPLGPRNGTPITEADSAPVFPVSLQCASPATAGMMMADGPAGYVTATVQFDINASADAGAVKVAPGQDGVCTLKALPGFAVSSASFSVASAWTGDNQNFTRHVEIAEQAPDGSHGYSFTVKAKDRTEARLTLKFPISYH